MKRCQQAGKLPGCHSPHLSPLLCSFFCSSCCAFSFSFMEPWNAKIFPPRHCQWISSIQRRPAQGCRVPPAPQPPTHLLPARPAAMPPARRPGALRPGSVANPAGKLHPFPAIAGCKFPVPLQENPAVDGNTPCPQPCRPGRAGSARQSSKSNAAAVSSTAPPPAASHTGNGIFPLRADAGVPGRAGDSAGPAGRHPVEAAIRTGAAASAPPTSRTTGTGSSSCIYCSISSSATAASCSA